MPCTCRPRDFIPCFLYTTARQPLLALVLRDSKIIDGLSPDFRMFIYILFCINKRKGGESAASVWIIFEWIS